MKTKKILFAFGLTTTIGAVGCGEDTGGDTATGATTFTETGSETMASSDDTDSEAGSADSTTATGDGDGDSATGDGDGDSSTGDGDGDSTTTGDGDGDSSTGDGDGDSSTGDGDGDTTGDGDGDSTGDGDGDSTGDGDGDSTGDGDGDTTGDGDGDSTTTGDGDQCQAPATYNDCDGSPGALTTDPFQAIGLNCPGDETNSIQVTNTSFNSVSANAWRIASGFGTAAGGNYNGLLWAPNLDPFETPNMELIDPNTSTAMLILSTGNVAAPNANGVVVEGNGSQGGNGDNGNQDAGGLPAPLSAQYGSANGAGGTPFNDCDGVNDCSDSLYNHWVTNGWNNPNDKLWMSFDVEVPEGTFGYVFDFAYFSSEYPTFYNTQYNDLFIAWQVSEAYTGNVTFINDAPLTITSLEDAGAFQYKNTAPQLAGTGFEGDAGTGWFTARGAVIPGETANITFFIADMADSVLATGVLLDNFRWECEGCIPSEVDDCGLTPLPE